MPKNQILDQPIPKKNKKHSLSPILGKVFLIFLVLFILNIICCTFMLWIPELLGMLFILVYMCLILLLSNFLLESDMDIDKTYLIKNWTLNKSLFANFFVTFSTLFIQIEILDNYDGKLPNILSLESWLTNPFLFSALYYASSMTILIYNLSSPNKTKPID